MKLSVTQIILGLGILLAIAFSIAWDPTGFYIGMSFGEAGEWKGIFNPDTKEIIATIIAPVVLLLGIGAIALAISLLILKTQNEDIKPHSKQNSRKRRLIILQMALGLSVAVGAFLVTIWGFPLSYDFPPQPGDLLGRVVSFTPGPQFVTAWSLSFLVSLLGITYLACGVAQFKSIRPTRVTSNINPS